MSVAMLILLFGSFICYSHHQYNLFAQLFQLVWYKKKGVIIIITIRMGGNVQNCQEKP
jgi:hypothetical protein